METRRPLLALLVLCLAAPMVRAEVKMTTREDGTKFIYNETSEQRERRLADRLVGVPRGDLVPLIALYARDRELDERLVRAVVQVESGYNPRALSRKGAMGLMQLMPETARTLAVRDPYDPEENLRGGTTYLRWMLDRFDQRVDLALAAYNAGPTAVERHGGVPPYRETRDYVARILRLYRDGDPGPPETSVGEEPGRRVFVARDGKNQILLTTDPVPRR